MLILTEFKKYFEKKEGEFLNDKKSVWVLNIIEVLEDTDLYTFDFQKILLFFDKADVIKKINGFI
jgi:hypothetical protein